jgi:two-component system, OmpR family, sensor kinase
MLTGLGINVFARLFPGAIELPPTPPSVQQSVLMPVLTGGLIAMGLSGLLAWSLSRPIRLLRQAFGLAASGHLDMRVSPSLGRQRDEFADLGRDYDRMAEQLRALLTAQRRLLHDVSHELRSPLARLQMAVGLLQRSAEGTADALHRIEREVQRLDQLVGEVLTLARLESGVPLGERCEIDVVALLASVAEDARFEARSQGRDLSFCSTHASVLSRAHGELLLRAFENAIRNAVKYTPPGSHVEVTAVCQRGERELVVQVADRGPGLPAEALQRVFQPFVRMDAGHQQGFGLGLAIARRSMEAHGGHISALLRPGGGLQLQFVLPLSPDATALNRL